MNLTSRSQGTDASFKIKDVTGTHTVHNARLAIVIADSVVLSRRRSGLVQLLQATKPLTPIVQGGCIWNLLKVPKAWKAGLEHHPNLPAGLFVEECPLHCVWGSTKLGGQQSYGQRCRKEVGK